MPSVQYHTQTYFHLNIEPEFFCNKACKTTLDQLKLHLKPIYRFQTQKRSQTGSGPLVPLK